MRDPNLFEGHEEAVQHHDGVVQDHRQRFPLGAGVLQHQDARKR
jgi:hypothetical protein